MLSRIGRTIPLLFAHLGAYSELLAHDVEAALALVQRLIGAMLLLFCLATALVVATSGVVIAAAWPTSFRWPVTVAVVTVLLGGCFAATRLVRSTALRLSGSFDGLRAELQVDAALLQRRFGPSAARAVVEESVT